MKKLKFIIVVITVVILLTSCSNDIDLHEITNNIPKTTDKTNETQVYKEEKYIPTIIFQTHGGTTVAPKNTKVLSYEPYTTKENYAFDGWYLDSTFNSPVSYPLEIKYDTVLHAKWLRTYGTYNCKNPTPIKGEIAATDGYYYRITPQNFELERLAQLGYGVNITIKYDVHYQKDYDVFLDPLEIGYLGAPEYETYIKVDNKTVSSNTKVKATQKAKTNTISYNTSVSRILNQDITFHYSTDNIQNIIHFENVIVEFTFSK